MDSRIPLENQKDSIELLFTRTTLIFCVFIHITCAGLYAAHVTLTKQETYLVLACATVCLIISTYRTWARVKLDGNMVILTLIPAYLYLGVVHGISYNLLQDAHTIDRLVQFYLGSVIKLGVAGLFTTGYVALDANKNVKVIRLIGAYVALIAITLIKLSHTVLCAHMANHGLSMIVIPIFYIVSFVRLTDEKRYGRTGWGNALHHAICISVSPLTIVRTFARGRIKSI